MTHPDFINSVENEALEQAQNTGLIDGSSKKLKMAELEYIRAWRKKNGEDNQPEESEVNNLTGFALSGGGIRSATFSLGVMQALAHRGLLKKFDYLSTVSGGGYIGSALTWLLSKKAKKKSLDSGELNFGVDKANFPFGSDDPCPGAEQSANKSQQRMLKYLRQHGYYLTPGTGISMFSLLGVVLRGTFLNLLVWIPLLVLIFLLCLTSSGLFHFSTDSMPILSKMISVIEPGCTNIIPPEIVISPPSLDSACATIKSKHEFALLKKQWPQLGVFELSLWVGFGIIGMLLIATPCYSIATRFRRGGIAGKPAQWYKKRRSAEFLTSILIPLTILTMTIGTLPIVAAFLQYYFYTTSSVAAILVGMASTIRHFFDSASTEKEGTPPGIMAGIGAFLFLYGIFLISYQIATAYSSTHLIWATLIALLAVTTGWFVNLNYISIHRYYRDRLMETFMPDIDTALQNNTAPAYGADETSIQDIHDPKDPQSPYHIVNTNLVLVNSVNKPYSERGGDNFILSPLYCGSNATGWCTSDDFLQGNMTLATAMAISGAAANPNTGVGGKGLTRNLLVSLVMSLLNLRLGFWANHPNPKKQSLKIPNHFLPGAYSFGNATGIKGLGFNENRSFLQLSDGGHFENTGVYELARRRTKLILVCDGGADTEFSFSDFQTTIRRIEDDFGARLQIIDGATPDDIVPVAQEEAVYPKEAHFAKQGHMLAWITYADGSRGLLIYLKTTLTKDLSFKVKGYAAQNPAFPDQSTADQFFDEVQFESYRELGFRLAANMMESEVPGELVTNNQVTGTLEDVIRNPEPYIS